MTYNDSNIEYGSHRELGFQLGIIVLVLLVLVVALKFMIPWRDVPEVVPTITEFTELAELQASETERLTTSGTNEDGSRYIPIAEAKAMLVANPALLASAFGGGAAVVPGADADPASVGKGLFQSKVCFTCHSIDGTRMVGPSLKGLWGKDEKLADGSTVTVDDAYLRESMLEPMVKVVEGYPPAMPPQVLTEVELVALVAYIESLQ